MTRYDDMVYSLGGIPNVGDLLLGVDKVYFVDTNYGSDGNTGDSWEAAYGTIQTAITASNATIDWAKSQSRFNAILVAPGVYAENLTPAYYCKIIGTGLPGTDTATEIHPTTGSCLTGTMLGLGLYNLHFEVNEAVDCLNIGICNNSEVAGCTFASGAAVTANGLTTENCTHLRFHHNSIESGYQTFGYGLYFGGGADKFAHNIRVHDNTIFATTAGIYIADTCTATQARIGPGDLIVATTTGIYDGSADSYITGEFVTATDAISHADSANKCLGNFVSNGGTGAFETTTA